MNVGSISPMHHKPDLSVTDVHPKGNEPAAAIKLVKGKKMGKRRVRNRGRS